MAPHNLVFTLIGACLLWVGWFGFNAGSNLEANGYAAIAVLNTIVATAAAALTWSLLECMTRGHASLLGAASGAVAGLVAVTPAAGFVGPLGAIVIGIVAGAVCLWAVVWLKAKLEATTTRSTCSASTASAASSAPSSPASSSTRRWAASASSTTP